MKLRKIITMGVAAIMAVSAMSISAFAYTDVYDDAGNVIAREYTQDEIDLDKIGAKPSARTTYPMTSSQPEYADALNISSVDEISQYFSIGSAGSKYTLPWYNSSSNVGIVFNDFSKNPSNFTLTIYQIKKNTNGTETLVKDHSVTPDSSTVAIQFPNLKSSYRYCIRITNNTASTATGYPTIVADVDDYMGI